MLNTVCWIIQGESTPGQSRVGPPPRTGFVLPGHCVAHVPLAFDQDPRSLSNVLLSSLSFTSLSVHPRLSHPRCRIQHLPLFPSYGWWLPTPLFLRSLCKAFMSVRESSTPPSFIMPENLPSIPSSCVPKFFKCACILWSPTELNVLKIINYQILDHCETALWYTVCLLQQMTNGGVQFSDFKGKILVSVHLPV